MATLWVALLVCSSLDFKLQFYCSHAELVEIKISKLCAVCNATEGAKCCALSLLLH